MIQSWLSVSVHTFVQKAVQRMQACPCSTQTWVALDCYLTVILHQWFFFDVPCRIGHDRSFDDLVQPLHTCSHERGELIMASCPRDLAVLDHPVTVVCPCWTVFQQGLSALLHLLSFLCMGRILGNLCTSVYFCRMFFDSLSCKPDSCYLVQTVIT